MDFNFELILTLAVLVTLVFWLISKFVTRKKDDFIGGVGDFFPVLAFVLVLRSFLYEPFQIPSGSMIPTLKIGDFILVNKFTYGVRLPVLRTKVIDINSPERGDVMVFFPPHKDQYFIKRVIGLPGDKVQFLNGDLFVNGEKINRELVGTDRDTNGYQVNVYEEYLADTPHILWQSERMSAVSQRYSDVVPDGHYLMVGDNRDNSNDGRSWGFVPEENIVGKAVSRWMHWDEFFSMPSFSSVGPIQ